MDAREAREYLIARIVQQADVDRVPLSTVERQMLYFTESGWTPPGMEEISEQFDRGYDSAAYERKIRLLVRNLKKNPGGDGARWRQALQVLRKEDLYLLVLIEVDVPFLDRDPADFLKLVLAPALAVLCLLVLVNLFSR